MDPDSEAIIQARKLQDNAIIHFQGRPVGTVAASTDEDLAASNYRECFIRDFFPSALVFLNDGKSDIVRNFLEVVLELQTRQKPQSGHGLTPGVMPASFRVDTDPQGKETLVADFGDRAIGRVAPVDSMMWWTILLGIYTRASGDTALAERSDFQNNMRSILELCLKDTFEVYPTLLVPDGSFMIDRRMGVYGHPLEIQALFYGMLQTSINLLRPDSTNKPLLKTATQRVRALRTYVRLFYWLDLERLNEIHRFGTEELGTGSVNMLNIHPETIPSWLESWLPEPGGYLVGNLGPGRMDFRFFAQGNLLAVLFGLATDEQSEAIMQLYDARWDELVGAMPVKICFPAAEDTYWRLQTGSDPKNAPWSYHNGGNWPVLLWPFVGAALGSGRQDLAEKACDLATRALPRDDWPEYYDGRSGRLIGRRANLKQTWSAAACLLAAQFRKQDRGLALFRYPEI